MNWTTEEKENLIGLLLSIDESNRALAFEILMQAQNPDEFSDVLHFLICCNIDLEELPNFFFVYDRISKTELDKFGMISDFFFPLRHQSKQKITDFLALFENSFSAIFVGFIKRAPHYAFIYNSLGNYLIRKKFKQKGLYYLEKAVHFYPNSFTNNFDYAYNLNESKKNAQTIISLYKKCIELEDVGIGPYHNIGRIYTHQLKDFQKALEYLTAGNSKFPCADTMIEMAMAEENMGNFDAAKNYLESAISAFPDSDLAYNNLAFMQWNYFKTYKEAKKNIKIALKISPKDGLYWHTLAEVEWYGFKNKEKALEALHQAKTVQPSYKAADAMIAEIEKTA